MPDTHKIVRDPIHGDIKFTGFFVDLLDTPEMQRLYNVKQLGFAHLVFPGAHHTRLEHCLGTYHIASQIAEVVGLEPEEQECIACAALLHDIGHGPFSHTLESILMEKFGVDHIDLAEKLLLGEYDIFQPGEKAFVQSQHVVDVLKNTALDTEDIVDIIRGQTAHKPYLSQILNSSIDVDQLDYLVRDAYYTGVAYGMIDLERLVQTLTVYEDDLVIRRKGVGSVENMLLARGLMYSSVYFHKTVRIAELMLSKAIEEIKDPEPFAFFRMTDGEIMNALQGMGSFQYEMVTRLKYRMLFKQAFAVSQAELDATGVDVVRSLEDAEMRLDKERELEAAFSIPRGHIIIDVPRQELLRAEPRLRKTDIGVLDKDVVKSLDDFTPVAGAIRSRVTPDWALMVVTDERFRDAVSKKAEKLLF
jgi:hypothetical protein